MIRLLLACLVLLWSTAAGTAAEAEPNLSGAWHGTYSYGNTTAIFPFEAELTDVAGKLGGRMAEANTLSSEPVDFLIANIDGERAADGSIAFTKTYDGTGGLYYSVKYVGRLTGDLIEGTWDSGPGMWGTFKMWR